MTNKSRKVLVAASAILAVFIAIGALFGQSDDRSKLYKKFDIFVEVMNFIRNEYVEPVQPTTIFDGALKGMARMLDSESSYLTPQEYERFQREVRVRTAGTGISVFKHPGSGYALVLNVKPGSPAEEGGLKKGDYIRAIDGTPTRELSIMMIDLLLKGKENSVAEFRILRSGVQETLTFEIPRKSLPEETIEFSDRNGVGYIHIPNFKLGAIERLQEACDFFKAGEIDSLIIDIRGNTTGELEEAIHAADLFVSGGKLLSIVSNSGATEYTADEFAYSFNLQILCDESTARSAEAFAVALADCEVASLVGRSTRGLATVQKQIRMEDGGLLNISNAKCVGPEGTEILGQGVKPDVQVESSADDSNADNILKTALERARTEMDKAAA